MDEDDPSEDFEDDRERLFHSTVREYIIFLLVFLILFILGSSIIDRLKRNSREDYFSTDEDEATVYKISLYLCVFALSITIFAAMLHPVSIISNEVLLLYPNSYYVKWLNHSLIQAIWSMVFLFSNVSLFILLPFAYLFTESEGFGGYRRGVRARVNETFTVLLLVSFIFFGLSCVLSSLFGSSVTCFAFLEFGTSYLPFLYSCISFFGVLLLLICTPLGFTSLFSLVSGYLVKPQFLHNLNDEYYETLMEEDLLRRRLRISEETGKTYLKPEPMCPIDKVDADESDLLSLHNGALQTGLAGRLNHVQQRRSLLEMRKSTSSFQRNIVYPVAMLALLALTVITVLVVLVNSFKLLVGINALPKSTAQFTLGLTSLSKLGPFGASLEVVIIFYLVATSLVGLYSVPIMDRLRPRRSQTPLSLLIANCALLLILSSALPLLCRTLGITNFDLLGHFGKIEWLGNFEIVLTYNFLFAGVTTVCLVNKLTAPVCKELWARMKTVIDVVMRKGKRHRHHNIKLQNPLKLD